MHGALQAPSQPVEKRSEGGNGDREPHHQAPNAGGARNQPAEQKQQQGCRGHQTSSQIVENAPSANDGKRIGYPAAWARYQLEDPRRYLPVATNPAMLTLAIARVVKRQVFEQFDFRGQTDAHVRPFNQVVTEQGLERKAICEDSAECADFVDRLAMKDSFSKQVLLGI